MAVGFDESVPLYSVEAEMSTLGAMLLSERAAEEIVTILAEDDFYRPSHRLIFRAMKSLIGGHKPIDMVTLDRGAEGAWRPRERRRLRTTSRRSTSTCRAPRTARPTRRSCSTRLRCAAWSRRGGRSSASSTTQETPQVQEKVDKRGAAHLRGGSQAARQVFRAGLQAREGVLRGRGHDPGDRACRCRG